MVAIARTFTLTVIASDALSEKQVAAALNASFGWANIEADAILDDGDASEIEDRELAHSYKDLGLILAPAPAPHDVHRAVDTLRGYWSGLFWSAVSRADRATINQAFATLLRITP